MPRVLLLSHSTPYPPDKGEKIRANNIVRALTQRNEVHLVCFAREARDIDAARELEHYCASVYVERLSTVQGLLRAAWPFLTGDCLNLAFFRRASVSRAVARIAAEKPFDAAVALTLPMVPFVPRGTPYIFDLQDVDSAKWLDYAATRRPSFLFRTEARRLRELEIEFARKARCTILVSQREEEVFRSYGADVRTAYVENGMNLDRYDPAQSPRLPELRGRRYIVFTGTMNYYPNAVGAVHFARNIFPDLRRRDPSLELMIVGRNPGKAVRGLGAEPGITVTGAVADTRPYLRDSVAAIAPLQLARGNQLKVLEALAMGKPVLISPEVAYTFGDSTPHGTYVCGSAEQYWQALGQCVNANADAIRAGVSQRFDFIKNAEIMLSEIDAIAGERKYSCAF